MNKYISGIMPTFRGIYNTFQATQTRWSTSSRSPGLAALTPTIERSNQCFLLFWVPGALTSDLSDNSRYWLLLFWLDPWPEALGPLGSSVFQFDDFLDPRRWERRYSVHAFADALMRGSNGMRTGRQAHMIPMSISARLVLESA
jgi:hypothetical protein